MEGKERTGEANDCSGASHISQSSGMSEIDCFEKLADTKDYLVTCNIKIGSGSGVRRKVVEAV